MDDIFNQLLTSLAWFALCLIIFSVLAVLMPLHRHQPLWRQDSWTDTIYWMLMPLLYAPIGLLLASGGLYLMHGGDQQRLHDFVQSGYPPIAGQPLWLQFVLLIVISDFLQYWLHRLFHRSALWRFHAIHHSPKEVDWMVAARFHPVNFIISSSCVGTLMFLLGFSPVLFALMVPFNYLYSGMVHANLNWTFGPLKYLFASPVFHHWHHTLSDQGGNKNFAATLAIYDVIFGSFYMPADQRPEVYGVDRDDVPQNIVGQLFYPFRDNADQQPRQKSPAAQPSFFSLPTEVQPATIQPATGHRAGGDSAQVSCDVVPNAAGFNAAGPDGQPVPPQTNRHDTTCDTTCDIACETTRAPFIPSGSGSDQDGSMSGNPSQALPS